MEIKTVKGNDISNYVQLPFDDAAIGALVMQFIKSDCSCINTYNTINKKETGDEPIPEEMAEFIDSLGPDKPSKYWAVFSAYACFNPLEACRIVLNIKGKDKKTFAQRFLQECKAKNLPYIFKFSKRDIRNDQIVIESPRELLGQYIAMAKSASSDLEIGNPPALYGTLRSNPKIGVGEAFETWNFSPSQMMIFLVYYSMTKYLADHSDELDESAKNALYELCPAFHPDKLEYYTEKVKTSHSDNFKKRVAYYMKHIYLGTSATQTLFGPEKNYEGKFFSIKLGPVISEIYNGPNKEEFLKEIIRNYRMIATEAWGRSESILFSQKAFEQGINFSEVPVPKEIIGKFDSRIRSSNRDYM